VYFDFFIKEPENEVEEKEQDPAEDPGKKK
jgi:hypothetical protein